jgi:phospholipid-binding lipoprotein MlaA
MSFLRIHLSKLLIALLICGGSIGFLAPLPSFAADQNNNYKNRGLQSAISKINTINSGFSEVGIEIAQNNIDYDDVNDPLESMNRVIFEFNEGLQDYLLRPTAKFYNKNVNETLRMGIGNFLSNLSAPVILANDLLQGNIDRAITTFARMLINTTMGIFGLADVATELGIERHKEDFGQTLGSYGIGEGFYLVLPLFGPSNPRDALGKLFVDSYFDPVGHYAAKDVNWGMTGGSAVDEYSGIVDELQQIKMTSVDYYAAIRSLYRQKRKAEINNGSEIELPPIPDLGYDALPENFSQSIAGR